MDQKILTGIKGKVCVTGAAGFFASWLVKRLLESGYYVVGTVRDPGDYRKIGHLWELEGAKERLHLVKAELMDEGSFDEAIMGCEGVFHTAFPVIWHKYDPKVEILDPAVKGTMNVLRSCKKNPMLKKVVLTSSVSAVARPTVSLQEPLDEFSWTSEEYCEKNQIWYALAKTQSERVAWDFAKENNINLVTVIPSFFIGPSLPRDLHVTAGDVLSFLKGDAETFPKRGRMGYVDTDDVARCHILVYEDDTAEGRYICDSTALDIPELAAILAKRYPWLPIPTSFNNYEPKPYFEYNTSKAKKLVMKFKGIEEMFDDCVQSLKDQGYLP